ncbi:uncharacterized protein LOC112177440 [Rosa chinensis]|uniref:uncharacterized protein LOC112177440 n=1 Tax=Rosa chinensis TaxID=74649 RepID=UPI000D0929B9|nr:uncharacterized protein LOC112177440 [Rosa chinensis]
MLSQPILKGRIGKWILALSEFSLQYVPQKAVKGQAIADFLAHHPMLDAPELRELEVAANLWGKECHIHCPEPFTDGQAAVMLQPWVLYFDGSRTDTMAGARITLENPARDHLSYSFQTLELLDQFNDVDLEHILREQNFAANKFAQLATGVTLRYGVRERILKVEGRMLPSWMTADRRISYLALNYFLRNNELRRRGEDGVDFRCVYGSEVKQLMREAHSSICGAHQAGPKMRWLLRRHGYFWPSILKDCIMFAKGCLDWQAHRPVQHVPNIPMQPIIKPWPSRGWALDLIGMIHPHSSLQHKFIIVATDFFTKWVEAKPLKETSGGTLRQFLFRNIICRFGIPEVFVSDRGVAFMGSEADKLHKILYETLWAYRTSKRNPTATTPYALMFGHDAVLPLEVNVQSLRVQEQHHLIGEDYIQAMWQEHEDLSEKRLEALDGLVMEKQ